MAANNIEIIKKQHPCFSNEAHFNYGRVHLPVAPKCNIQCCYCVRSLNSTEDRPGVADEIISPQKALERVSDATRKCPAIKVAAVAGPGDPLANEETFEALDLVSKKFPGLIKCLSTNGLALYEKASLLAKIGVNTITVTVNAVDPEVGARLYEYINYNGHQYKGTEGAEILINRQIEGIKEAISRGMLVKINTVLIPDINGSHVIEIAKKYKELGAYIMNIMPLIPVGRFKEKLPPTCKELSDIQNKCKKYMEQFINCKQCRADACGVPGKE